MATVGDIAKLQWEMFVVLKLKPVMLGCKGWEGWEGGGRGWRCIKSQMHSRHWSKIQIFVLAS